MEQTNMIRNNSSDEEDPNLEDKEFSTNKETPNQQR